MKTLSKLNQPLVLASTSKFRQWQLQKLKLDFIAVPSNVQEDILISEKPAEIAARLSQEKALAVRERHPYAIIIGSDQVVYCQNKILGKPLDYRKALDMLYFINGQIIHIYSGIYVFNTSSNNEYKHVEKTEVKMRTLSTDLVKQYLQQEPDALFCAGAIKSEGLGMILIESMTSKDPNAVIGLPMYFLIDVLLQENFWNGFTK